MFGLRLSGKAGQRILPALVQTHCFAVVRGDALRIAPHLHVTSAEVDRLIDTIARVLQMPD